MQCMNRPAWCRLGLVLACLSLPWATSATTPTAAAAPTSATGMLGFTADGAAQQAALERRFDTMLSASEMRGWLKRLSSRPNQVGAPHDKANAEFLLAKFRQWGWDAHIETFDVMYATPTRELVELVAPTRFRATLHEPPVKGDRTSALSGALPPYNVYGADGDVTAPLVYVNYGMPDDYRELARLGISVKGKIVIARYGHGWRGLKPKLAWRHGAVGCLIYSDPREDGYARGDPYPKGGWRPAEGVQRGSVAAQAAHYQGDPTTPGYGSVPGAKHLSIADSKPILKIPVLPMSYADATPLLKALAGPVAPAGWRGALPFTYHIGPGPAKVHLVVKSDWRLTPVYDVIAKLPGATDPGQWVIRGNHHDAWVFGAFDPLAGTVAMMGSAKAMGALYREGWRPKRTIVFASWDGEEPGLLGSTEWAETHADELKKRAVLYVNSDTNARGFLRVGGSQALQHLVNQVAASVVDPETGVSVLRRLRAHILVRRAGDSDSPAWKAAAGGGDPLIAPLGSGSDYTAFLDHLGIATLSIGFGGEDADAGIYHSRYDSFDHFRRFGDPTFAYEVALAEVGGRLMMRTADAEVLPLRFTDFSHALSRYLARLHKHVAGLRKAAHLQQALFAADAYKLAADPTHPLAPPARLSPVPSLPFAALGRAAQRLGHSARAYETAYHARVKQGLAIPAVRLRRINALMGSLHQHLLEPDGLPGRPWYKNAIVAPGVLTGYGVKIFPAVARSLGLRQWNKAAANAKVVAATLDGYRHALDRLTSLLQP